MVPETLPMTTAAGDLPGRVALYADRPPRAFAVGGDGSLRELSVRLVHGTPVVRLTVEGRQRSLALTRLALAWVRRGPPGRRLAWDVAEGAAGLRWRDPAAGLLRGPGGQFTGRVAGHGLRAELTARARAVVEANASRGLLPSAARITIDVPPPRDVSSSSAQRSSRTRRDGGL